MASGSCVCGNITYQYTGAPALKAICHCLDCQHWSGSSGISNVAVPTSAFSITKGTPKAYTRTAASGMDHALFFCDNCGSSLYSQPTSMAGTTLIKAGCLDGKASDISPVAIEFFTKDRPAYELPILGAQQAKTME